MNNKFAISDLPFDQFKVLGMDKKDVLSLPSRTLQQLLSGNVSSLIRFNNFSIGEEKRPVDLKIQLQDIGGKPTLILHPINAVLENKYKLSDEELNGFSSNKISSVSRQLVVNDGKNKKIVDALIFKDTETNEFVAVNKNNIIPPDSINGYEFTEKDKEAFKNGKRVKVGEDEFIANPISEIGVTDKYGSERNINDVQNKKAKYHYKANELLFDVVMLASGLGAVVMISHLLKLAGFLSEKSKLSNLQNSKQQDQTKLWKAIEALKDEIKTLKEEKGINNISAKDLQTAVDRHFGAMGEDVFHVMSKENPIQGTVQNMGKEKYKNDPENNSSFFAVVETSEGIQKTIWGHDLEEKMKGFKIGDDIQIQYNGISPDNRSTLYNVSSSLSETLSVKQYDVDNIPVRETVAVTNQEVEQGNIIKGSGKGVFDAAIDRIMEVGNLKMRMKDEEGVQFMQGKGAGTLVTDNAVNKVILEGLKSEGANVISEGIFIEKIQEALDSKKREFAAINNRDNIINIINGLGLQVDKKEMEYKMGGTFLSVNTAADKVVNEIKGKKDLSKDTTKQLWGNVYSMLNKGLEDSKNAKKLDTPEEKQSKGRKI